MNMHTIIIGANAAGLSAAAKIIRAKDNHTVTVYDKDEIISFGSCGLPYFIGDYFNDHTRMFSRSKEEFISSGINIKTHHTVTKIDATKQEITLLDSQNNLMKDTYDSLVIATGATPIIPPLSGIEKDNIFVLRTLSDGIAIKKALKICGEHAVVVGAGFIGLEIVEALERVGKKVTLIELEERALKAAVSEEISHLIHEEMKNHGIKTSFNERVIAFEGKQAVEKVITDKGEYPSDIVILSIGVRPQTSFLQDSGIKMLSNGAIIVDSVGRTSLPNIYAGGDCAAVQDMRTQLPIYSPLATTANKLGRIIGEHIVGIQRRYPGSLSSACVKVFDVEVGRTGASEHTSGTKTVVIKDKNQTNYYPGQKDILLRIVYEEDTHKIVGAEVAGKNGAVLRLDTLAMAIQLEGTIEDLSLSDFCYAPPFARTWDVLNIAGNVAMSKKT
jgi:NADPH-dependent 2,4-dienoyl-CoA reductase/sulfur reductase-like enzyme